MKDLPIIPAYGTWIVTTEGDCEGRSTRNLGTHTGYLDEIAFALASQAYYGLQFKSTDPVAFKQTGKSGVEVQVSLDISTGTWNLSPSERAEYMRKVLRAAGRTQTTVEPGQYYACVKLCDGASPEAREKARIELLAAQARKKLTAEELKALGL